MLTVKNYAGSVYGGLGQLLMCYCEAEQLPVGVRQQVIGEVRADHAGDARDEGPLHGPIFH